MITTKAGTIIATFTPVNNGKRQDIFAFRFHEKGVYILPNGMAIHYTYHGGDDWTDLQLPIKWNEPNVVGISWDVVQGLVLTVNDRMIEKAGGYITVDLFKDFAPYFHVGYDQDQAKSCFYDDSLSPIEIISNSDTCTDKYTLVSLVNQSKKTGGVPTVDSTTQGNITKSLMREVDTLTEEVAQLNAKLRACRSRENKTIKKTAILLIKKIFGGA